MPLDLPLGPWLPAVRHIRYDKYRTEEWVYERQENGFMRFKHEPYMHNTFSADTATDVVPDHAIPVRSLVNGRYSHPLSEYNVGQVEQPQPPADDTESHHPELVKSATSATGVSDGSVDPVDGRGAFAWVLSLPGRTAWIKRRRPVRSNPRYMTSYRAEMAGVADLLQYIKDEGLHTIEITLWCDNEAVVKVLSGENALALTDMNKSEADLTKTALDALACLPKVSINHVLGHQDDDTPYDALPFEAQLNADCDAEAKECVFTVSYDTSRPPPTEGSGAALYLDNFLVTTELEEQIHYAAHSRPLLTYVRDKFNWTDNDVNGINWRAIGHAKNRLKLNDNVRISKMMHDWLNVGRQKNKFDYLIYDGLCPCCGSVEEDTVHLYQCSHTEMKSALEEGLDDIRTNLDKANVPNAVVTAFCELLRRATLSTRERKHWHCNHTDEAVTRQDSLGTFAILRGHHHRQWCQAITERYRPRASPPETRPSQNKKRHRDRNPLEMSALLVEEVWNLFNKLWQARNDILHGSESYEAQVENRHRTEQLLTYRRRRNIFLSPGDRHLIEHLPRDIISWDKFRKKKLLRVLDTCRAQYMKELLGSKTQTELRAFGFTRTLAMEITEVEPD